MPYQLISTVHHDGVSHEKHRVVSDEVGDAMRLHHPSALTRVPHDDDLCGAHNLDCEHLRKAEPARQPLPPAPLAPPKE